MSESSKKDFADRVKRLMAAKNMDVAQLVDKGQLQASTVYQWLSGKFMPRGESLGKLAQALDASTDYLLGRVSYSEGFEDRDIAVHESFSLYLKGKGVTPSHPEYEMYDRIKETAKPPVPASLEEWEHLITHVIPIIQEYSKKRKRPRLGLGAARKDQQAFQKSARVVHLQKPKTRPVG